MTDKSIALSIVIGAALGAGYKAVFGEAQKTAKSLGSSLNDVNRRVAIGEKLQKQRARMATFEKAYVSGNLAGSDRLLKKLEAERKALWRITKQAEDAGYRVGNLDRELSSARRHQLVLRVGGGLKQGFSHTKGAALGAFSVGAGVFGLAASAAERGDSIAEDAQKLGVGVVALQELRGAAERAGTGVETLNGSMVKMSKGISEANAYGTGVAARALDELGLSAEYLDALTPDQQLNAIADAMAEVQSKGDRTRLAMELFGEGGVSMTNILEGGSSALEKMRAAVRATGQVMDEEAIKAAAEFNDVLDDTKGTMLGLRVTLGAALLPVVGDLLKDIHANRDTIIGWGRSVGEFVQRVGGWGTILSVFGSIFAINVAGGVAASIMQIGGLGAAIFRLTAAALPVLITGIKAVGVAIAANPIGLLITALVVGAGLIIANWDRVKVAVGDALQWIAEKAKMLWEKSPLGMIIRGAQSLIGSAVGDSGGSAQDVERQVSAVQRGNTTTTNTTHAPITINAAPGQNPEAVAQIVMREFDARDQRNARQQRGALYDSGFAPAL